MEEVRHDQYIWRTKPKLNNEEAIPKKLSHSIEVYYSKRRNGRPLE